MTNRIKEWRNKRGLSQEKVAEAMGIKKAAVSKLEQGKMNLTQDYMNRFAKIFHCAPQELLPSGNASNDQISQADMAVVQILHGVLKILLQKKYVLPDEMEDIFSHANALSEALRLKNATKIVDALHISLAGEAHQSERELIHKLLQLAPAGSA